MSRTSTAALMIFCGLTACASATFAQETPDPNQVYIQRLTYAGPGCPSGSVAHNLSDDAQAFTLLFDSFTAEVGPGLPSSRARNSCRVTVDLRFPNGWSYSLFTVDYRGYISLDRSVSGTQRSTYWFQSASGSARTLSTTKWGPLADDYELRDTLAIQDLNWSPCGRNRAMNIDAEIFVDNALNRLNSGYITIDSLDGQLQQIYGIMWQRCP